MTLRSPLIVTALALAACQPAPVAPAASVEATAGASLAVRPAIVPGQAFRLQAVVTAYDETAVDHLRVALHKVLPGPSESAEIQSVAVPKGSFSATITFGNLDFDTTYRVRAHAYFAAAEIPANLISKPSSYVDIPVVRNDQPLLGNLLVNLADQTFAGAADSSGLTVTDGAVVYAGTPAAVLNQPIAPTHVETVADLPATAGSNVLDVAIAPDGTTYVADTQLDAVYRLDGSTLNLFAGGATQLHAPIAKPGALAVDAAGRVFIGEEAMITRVAGGSATELAGDRAQPSFADGPGASARFNIPRGMAVAPSGDVYIADTGNHRIRRLTPGGAVSTVAGISSPGATNGNGGAARFAQPGGVAVGPTGDLFVADTLNHLIRRINPAGDVTTFAGSGAAAIADGKGLAASFQEPAGLAFDKAGHLWVADQIAVRRIAPDGTVTTIAGGSFGLVDGPVASAHFNSLSGLAIAPNGDVYVVEKTNRKLRRLFVQAAG